MTYTAPDFNHLVTQVKLLENQCEGGGDARLKQVELLKGMADLMNSQEDRDSLLGACLYIMHKIEQEYYFRSPENSRLYVVLKDLVNSASSQAVSDREKLILINKFYQFRSGHKAIPNDDKLMEDIRAVLAKKLADLTNSIAKVVNAVPTELSVTKHMSDLPEKYQEAKQAANSKAWLFHSRPNNKRIFLTQLAKIISTARCEDEENLPKDSFTRSQRIKMGALLYTEKSIAREYYIRSPKNSQLYRECRTILNIPKEYNLDEMQQLACLTAFKSYIDDNASRGALEEQGRKLFGKDNLLIDIDAPLSRISDSILNMQDDLNSNLVRNWPATAACVTLGALLGAAPGYALGQGVGLLIGEGRHARPASNVVAGGLRNAASAYYGYTSSTTGYYAFVLSDFLVANTLSRGFAKIFELIGMAAGGVAGGAVGFTFDLTYKSFKDFCIKYLDFYDHHPEQMRHADPELVKCLLELPAEIFQPDKQNQIRYAMDDSELVKVAGLAN